MQQNSEKGREKIREQGSRKTREKAGTKDEDCFVCAKTSFSLFHPADLTYRRCLFCGAMWQFPLPKTDAYEDFYTADYYKKIWGYSPATDMLVGRSKYATSKKMIRLLRRLKPGGMILDVGCGLGYLLSFLRQDSFAYDVFGVEISPFAKEIAEKRIGTGHIFLSLEEVKKKKLHFDAILFFDSMEHISDQEQLFADIYMLLNPDGVVLVIMPDPFSWISKLMGKYWIEYKKDHVLFYSKKAFRLQLQKHGFQLLYRSSTWKTVTLYYFIHYLSVFRVPLLSDFLSSAEKILPHFVLQIPLSLPIGQMIAVFSPKTIK